ncbi:MAG: GNAT family N-acetyltransferase [Phycisphaerales bacterium JB052]
MSRSVPDSNNATEPPNAVRLSHDLRLWACERLVTGPNRRQAARNLIASASSHGIDLDMLWGVVGDLKDPKATKVRQVCLAVLGAGRTAMLFHSSPEHQRSLGSRATQIEEISACISTCLQTLGQTPERVGLAQSLIEPRQRWAREACERAGMVFVGELAYMRKTVPSTGAATKPEPVWPEGITVRSIHSLEREAPVSDRDLLIEALEQSYIDTLDCPELCGLRSMDDVVDSHTATGEFNPDHWLLILRDGHPAGCCLLSHCPANHSVELVYLGIAPIARGMRLGRRVLDYGISRLGGLGAREVTCAVDTRNAPAIAVYESLGFTRFDSRIGYVAPIPLP